MSSTHFFDMQKLVRDLYQLQRENEVTHLNRILEKDAQMEKMKAYYESEMEKMKVYYESEMEKMKVYYESEMEKKETEMKETNMWFEHQLLEVRKIYYWEREKNSPLESDFEERTQEAELLHENMTKTLLGLQENIEAKEAKDKELHATREMALKKQIEVLQESERALQKEFERVYASEITKEVELLVASEKVEMLMASAIALKKEIEGEHRTAKEAKEAKELHATREMALKKQIEVLQESERALQKEFERVYASEITKQIEVLQESERALQKEFERVYASEITKEVELLVASEKVEMLMASEIALKKEIEGDTKTIVELERIIEAMDAAFVSLIMRK